MLKKRLRSKKFLAIMSSAFVLTVALAFAVVTRVKSSAGPNGNWKDSKFEFSLWRQGQMPQGETVKDKTSVRRKKDKSKIYVKVTDKMVMYPMWVAPYGTNKKDLSEVGAKVENCYYKRDEAGYSYDGYCLQKGTVGYISNTIREKGYDYAFLKATCKFGNWHHQSLEGVWSPDNYYNK